MPVMWSVTPEGRQQDERPAVPRRMVNTLVLAVATAWITGCSPTPNPRQEQPGRTSGGGSNPPGPDRPGDVADLGVFATTLAHSRSLTDLSGDMLDRGPKPLPAVAEVNRVLSIQTAVLTRLVQAGSTSSPDSSAEGTSGISQDQSTQTAPSSAGDLAELLRTQSSATVLQEELPSVGAANIATLMSLHGTRRASVELLTDDELSPALSGPEGPGAITALAGLRQCQYGLQVLAARAGGQDRAWYLRALRRLRSPTQQLTELAGSAAPAAPLGYGLPTEIGTVDERRVLAQNLLLAAMEAVIAGSAARSGDPAAIEGTVALMSLVSAVGTSVGVPLTGFPGLTVPSTGS